MVIRKIVLQVEHTQTECGGNSGQWTCIVLAATGATMANPGTITEEKTEKLADHSTFGISKMVTKGRIQEGKLPFLLEILPTGSIDMTLHEADMLLKLAKKYSSYFLGQKIVVRSSR